MYHSVIDAIDCVFYFQLIRYTKTFIVLSFLSQYIIKSQKTYILHLSNILKILMLSFYIKFSLSSNNICPSTKIKLQWYKLVKGSDFVSVNHPSSLRVQLDQFIYIGINIIFFITRVKLKSECVRHLWSLAQ